MADQLDSNTRSPNSDSEIDDPLAELARIIGYERPTEGRAPVENASQSNEFDLEAELMRELDVPQIPAIDEPAELEADDEYGAPSPDAGAYSAPYEDDAAYAEETWLDAQDGDLPDWDTSEELSTQDLARAIEDEVALSPELTTPADETRFLDDTDSLSPDDDQEPQDFWASSELDADPEPVVEPAFAGPEPVAEPASASPEPIGDEPDHAFDADFQSRRDAVAMDPSGDDVLADMFRFDLPDRQTGHPRPPFAPVSAPAWGPEATFSPSDIQSPREDEFAVEPEAFDDVAEASPFGDVVEASPFDDVAETSPFDEPVLEAAPPPPRSDEPAVDFEDFLSSELDDYEHALSTGDAGVASAWETGGEAGRGDAEPAEVAHGEWNDLPDDDQDSVFDDAAEELLADMAIEDSDPDGGEVSAESWPNEDWSVAAIEDGVSEELNEELEDMFELPDRPDDRYETKAEDPDEIDIALDLEEVLAEASAEFGDGWDEEPSSPEQDEQQQDDAASAGWLAAKPADAAIERDAMSEAFLGLVPAANDAVPQPSPVPNRAAAAALGEAPDQIGSEPEQQDWLDGFETAETAEQAGADDFYFDAQLISEPEVGVEAVSEIDVPDMAHDEPQPVDPDYDTEIEREFADIIEASEAAPETVASPAYAVPEDWSRGAAAARGYEVSDDYIALERELSADDQAELSYQGAAPYREDQVPFRQDHAGDYESLEADERRSGSRGPLLALVVLGVAVLAGAGALGWSMLAGDTTTADGAPRIIRADTEPVKVLPENPGGVTVPNQDKAVYDRVAGGDSSSPGQPALVNSAEEPVDVVQRTLDPEILPLEGRGDVAEKSEERLAAGETNADGVADPSSAPVVSPRRVRTMIVKPDGSIVAREEPVAEPQAQAEQPAAAPVETVSAEAATPLEAAAPAAVDGAATEPASAAADAQPVAAEPAGDQSIAPVRVVQTQAVRAPVPQTRPADQPVTVVGTVTQGGNVADAPAAPAAPTQPVEVASAPAAAAPAAAPAAPAANPGGYYMQIASQPTEEGAQASWRTLSSRFNSVIGGRGVDIQRADIPGKGVFHRVRVPAGTRDEANALCSRYKAAGGSCFVSR